MAAEPSIFGAKHLSHAAAAERLDDSIMRDCFANHRGSTRGHPTLNQAPEQTRINCNSPLSENFMSFRIRCIRFLTPTHAWIEKFTHFTSYREEALQLSHAAIGAVTSAHSPL